MMHRTPLATRRASGSGTGVHFQNAPGLHRPAKRYQCPLVTNTTNWPAACACRMCKPRGQAGGALTASPCPCPCRTPQPSPGS
eukprot:790326-Prymnesium_polylepis.1